MGGAKCARQQAFKPLSATLDNDPVTDPPNEIPKSVIDGLVYTDATAAFSAATSNETAQAFGQVRQPLLKLHPEYFTEAVTGSMIV